MPGKVTFVYFSAAECGPWRAVTPALEKMASSDADIALRKIDLTEPGSQEPDNMDTSASEVVLSRR